MTQKNPWVQGPLLWSLATLATLHGQPLRAVPPLMTPAASLGGLVAQQGCRPSSKFAQYESTSLRFDFPNNWQRNDVNGALAFGSDDDDCYVLVVVDDSVGPSVDLLTATRTFIGNTTSRYPRSEVLEPPILTTMEDGRRATRTTWINVVDGQRVRNRTIAFRIPRGLLVFQFSALETVSQAATPVFDQILRSVRLTDSDLPDAHAPLTAAPSTVQKRPGEVNIVGVWAGRRSLSMTGGFFPNWADGSSFSLPKFTDPNPPRIFIFEFRTDRTYSFEFGQGDAIWTSHSGTVALSRATDEASDRYPYLLTLTPFRQTLRTSPARRAEDMAPGLAELGPEARTFRLRSVEGDGLRLIDASAGGWLNDIGYFALYPVEKK